MAKRKRSAIAPSTSGANSLPPPLTSSTTVPLPQNVSSPKPKQPRRQQSRREPDLSTTNPNTNAEVLDSVGAYRASPDAAVDDDLNAAIIAPEQELKVNGDAGAEAQDLLGSELLDVPDDREGAELVVPAGKKRRTKGPKHVKSQGKDTDKEETLDALAKNVTATESSRVKVEENVGVFKVPEEDGEGENNPDEEEVKEALQRPPPVNSEVLPLPWKGRLGYACLNTYLRNSNPPVFSSRTCRIASILEHRHPLRDPSQPEHPTKNRPDKEKPADVARGQQYVEALGLANARDIIKMLRWNHKYGIKFLRLSSEMFPFASHDEYGYKLAPFAKQTLEDAGKVVAELGHRVTTHPGQFTQLGSPRKAVIDASIRDLEYHAEMLSLLNLPPQQNRDAVMILHLGGVFGDKAATLDRFRDNYLKLPQGIKDRLVLENDDVSWSVHDLLPVCQQLNIPLVLDFHHHNIVFDKDKLREGTKDIIELFPAILETWSRKAITPKMHYSEPCPDAVTPRQRRKHSPRVATLPPCPNNMDLMIEAKDKEQAVFELMRTFKLPGFDSFNDIIPYVRDDDNRPPPRTAAKKAKKGKKAKKEEDDLDAIDEVLEDLEKAPATVPEEDVGMGGPDRRVYWPPGMEEWLRPQKRVVKKKEEETKATPAKKKKVITEPVANGVDEVNTPAKKTPKRTATSVKKRTPKEVPTPETSEPEDEVTAPSDVGDDEDIVPVKKKRGAAAPARRSARASRVSYAEADEMTE